MKVISIGFIMNEGDEDIGESKGNSKAENNDESILLLSQEISKSRF
jgi:hypothetical protein